jgi:hypothetical protein
MVSPLRKPDRWLVKLICAKTKDLEYLAARFTGPTISITKGPDSYWLASSRFRDENRVREVATHLLRLAVGISRFEFVDIALPDTAEILAADARGPIHLTLAPKMFSSLRSSRARAGMFVDEKGEICQTRQLPDEAEILSLAEGDSVIEDAFLFFSYADEWWSLYKVYEVIVQDRGQDSVLVKEGIADGAELTRFRRTANDSRNGFAARHARMKGSGPPNYDPMSVEDGKILIGSMLLRWLRVRHESTRSAV